MTKEKRQIAIDADFFNKFTEENPDGELFLSVMEEFDAFPIMHEYVYGYELAANATVKKLKSEHKIKIIKDDDYLKTPESREKYENDFKRAYKILNGTDLTCPDVFKYCHQKENLGEIRSALMAIRINVDLFMSDDGGAKTFVTQHLSSRRHRLTVYNIFDTLKIIGEKDDKTIQWKQIKGFAKRVIKSKDKVEVINQIWHS